MANTTSIIEFQIGEIWGNAPMKPIPLTTLPNFHGLSSEDPDTFLFEFDVVYQGYAYVSDAKKLNIFSATFNRITLCWFMDLGGNSIMMWDNMKQNFLQKY